MIGSAVRSVARLAAIGILLIAASVLSAASVTSAAGADAPGTASGKVEPTASGRIEGRVIDGSTGQPLYGATVAIVGTGRGAATRNDGTYRIDGLPPGTYRLQFSFIGFIPEIRTDIVVSTSAPSQVNEELVPTSVRLETITVRPQLFVEELVAPASTTTLRREEIRRFPGAGEDVVATVTALPGVAQVSSGGRNDLLVRGGGPSENLFVVNGLEVPNINHFSTQGTAGGALSYVNLDFVDRVDFSAGGFGVQYGDKLSSVLDLDLRAGRTDRFGGKATISATQYGVDVEGPIGSKGSFLASARKSYLDLVFRAAGLPFIPVYTDYNLFVETPLSSKDRLSVLGLLARDRIDTVIEDAKDRRTVASLLDNNQDQASLGLRLRHLIDNGYADAVVGLNRTDYDLSQADTSQTPQEYYRTEAIENGLTLKASILKSIRGEWELSGGGSVRWVGTDNRTAFADSVYDQSGRRVSRESLGLPADLRENATGNKYDLWGQADRILSARWTWTVGLRADAYDAIDRPFVVLPRTAVIHRPSDRLKLLASVGRYAQAPSQVWLVNPANRSLGQLRSDQGVLSGELLLREDTSIRLETYYKRYSDLPAGIDPGSDSTAATDYLVLTGSGIGFGGREDNFRSFGYIDLASRGTGEALGFEILLRKKLSEIPCYGQLSIGVGKSGYRAPNGTWSPGPYDQRLIVNLSGGYILDPRWQFAARFRVVSGAPYTPVIDPNTNTAHPGETQNLPEEYLSDRLGIGHQLDLRVDRRWNFASWSLVTFLDIQNVYNFDVPRAPTWNFADQKIETGDAIGILPTIGISAEF